MSTGIGEHDRNHDFIPIEPRQKSSLRYISRVNVWERFYIYFQHFGRHNHRWKRSFGRFESRAIFDSMRTGSCIASKMLWKWSKSQFPQTTTTLICVSRQRCREFLRGAASLTALSVVFLKRMTLGRLAWLRFSLGSSFCADLSRQLRVGMTGLGRSGSSTYRTLRCTAHAVLRLCSSKGLIRGAMPKALTQKTPSAMPPGGRHNLSKGFLEHLCGVCACSVAVACASKGAACFQLSLVCASKGRGICELGGIMSSVVLVSFPWWLIVCFTCTWWLTIPWWFTIAS